MSGEPSQNNSSEETPETRSESQHALLTIARPLQSMHAIIKVVKVLYGYKRPVMYKDIASACGLHPVGVSQALSAAADVGLTQLAGKKGLYALTDKGIEFARLLTAGREGEARNLIRGLLKENPLWVEIVAFLNATRGQSRDPLDLVLEIERKSGKQWRPSMRNRVRDSVVSILDFSKMIAKDGSHIIPVGEEQIERGEEAELTDLTYDLSKRVSAGQLESDFAMLKGDDFTFEVRKDLKALEFAESQFAAWIAYLRKKMINEKEENRQSGGVPNQQQ